MGDDPFANLEMRMRAARGDYGTCSRCFVAFHQVDDRDVEQPDMHTKCAHRQKLEDDARAAARARAEEIDRVAWDTARRLAAGWPQGDLHTAVADGDEVLVLCGQTEFVGWIQKALATRSDAYKAASTRSEASVLFRSQASSVAISAITAQGHPTQRPGWAAVDQVILTKTAIIWLVRKLGVDTTTSAVEEYLVNEYGLAPGAWVNEVW